MLVFVPLFFSIDFSSCSSTRELPQFFPISLSYYLYPIPPLSFWCVCIYDVYVCGSRGLCTLHNHITELDPTSCNVSLAPSFSCLSWIDEFVFLSILLAIFLLVSCFEIKYYALYIVSIIYRLEWQFLRTKCFFVLNNIKRGESTLEAILITPYLVFP